MKYSHTLIRGKPWYARIGFNPTSEITSEIIKNNEKLLKKTLTSDCDLIKILNMKIKDDILLKYKEKIIKYIEKNSDVNIMKTMEYILKVNYKVFYLIYNDVYHEIGLKILMDNEYEMILD